MTTDLARTVADVDFKRIPKGLADRIAVDPPYYSQARFGCSTLEWCNLAAGRLDLYLHGGQMLWDYAAGSLILREAGGQVYTLDNDDFDAAEVWRRPSSPRSIRPCLRPGRPGCAPDRAFPASAGRCAGWRRRPR